MYCVILGDIVQSRTLDPAVRGQVTQRIKSALGAINAKYADSILAEFGLVRGDAIEGVLFAQRDAPQIMQEMMKAVYPVNKTKIRMSAVMGALTVVSSDRNAADGPAFHMATEQIEALKKQNSDHWLQVSFHTNTIAQELVEGLVGLLTALTRRWTERQREIVWAMDAHGQQNIVSKKLRITPAVVSKQLKAADYREYALAWQSLTGYLEKAEGASIPKEALGEALQNKNK